MSKFYKFVCKLKQVRSFQECLKRLKQSVINNNHLMDTQFNFIFGEYFGTEDDH